MKDTMAAGIYLGLLVMAASFIILKSIDYLFLVAFDFPLFRKPDTLQLLVLTTLAFLFRYQFKTERTENGKGVFLVTFISTIGYLVIKKFNFAPWPDLS